MAQILIVDDEPSCLSMLELLLGNLNHTVHKASNGDGALDLIKNHHSPFDLILLDIMMPGKTGLEVLQELRANSKIADIPVIIQSGTMHATPFSSKSLGVVASITKPYRMDELREAVENALAANPD